MIRVMIVILVLLIGCAMPPEPEPQFMGWYHSLDSEAFKTDFPNIKKLEQGYHGTVKYVTLSGRILMAHYDEKKGLWRITRRHPAPQEVEYHMSRGEWEFD